MERQAACVESARLQPPAQPAKCLGVAIATGDWAIGPTANFEALIDRPNLKSGDGFRCRLDILNEAILANIGSPHLELWLEQKHHVCGRNVGDDRPEEFLQRDEAGVTNDQCHVADLLREKTPYVCLLH